VACLLFKVKQHFLNLPADFAGAKVKVERDSRALIFGQYEVNDKR
jgi:hypothetical protein